MLQLKKGVYKAVKISIDSVSIDSKTIVAKKGTSASDTRDMRKRKAQRFMQRSAKKVYQVLFPPLPYASSSALLPGELHKGIPTFQQRTIVFCSYILTFSNAPTQQLTL